MALKPSEALQGANYVNSDELIRLESYIDEVLSVKFENESSTVKILYRTIENDTKVMLLSPVVRAIIKLYTAQGWSVRSRSDQQDGEWLEFESSAYADKVREAHWSRSR